MPTIYLLDDVGIYTGATDIDPYSALPRCTLTPPPALSGTEVAQWAGAGWQVLQQRHDPVDPPVPVPKSVTRAQGKAALITAGLWSGVLAFVAAIPDPTERALAEVALYDTQEWRRESPFFNAAATALGLTGEQLDGLFWLRQRSNCDAAPAQPFDRHRSACVCAGHAGRW